MTKNTIWFLTLVTLLSTSCSSLNSESAETVETIPTEFAGLTNPSGVKAAEAGAELYNIYCVPCHGETGLGDGPAGYIA